jgi:hypothetical protein
MAARPGLVAQVGEKGELTGGFHMSALEVREGDETRRHNPKLKALTTRRPVEPAGEAAALEGEWAGVVPLAD